MAACDRRMNRSCETGDTGACVRENDRFHITLCRAGNSEIPLPLLETVWMPFGPFMRSLFGMEEKPGIGDRHRMAPDAIFRDDAEVFGLAFEADIADAGHLLGRTRVDRSTDTSVGTGCDVRGAMSRPPRSERRHWCNKTGSTASARPLAGPDMAEFHLGDQSRSGGRDPDNRVARVGRQVPVHKGKRWRGADARQNAPVRTSLRPRDPFNGAPSLVHSAAQRTAGTPWPSP